jgi:general secretion pathway protein F
MPAYQYQALKLGDKTRSSGVINAASEREARELLREQDLVPTTLKVVAKAEIKHKGLPLPGFVRKFLNRVGSKEKVTFANNLGMMVKSGVPLTEALMYFETYAENPGFRVVIAEIRRDIMGGLPLSQALSRQKQTFDDIFVNVVRAGESSGELDAALYRLADLLERSEKVKMKVVSASVYPVIVLVIVGLVLLIMFLLVIPTFVDIYKQMGVQLPLITQIMVAISDVLRNWWFISFPVLGGIGYSLYQYLKSPSGKQLLDRVVLKIPVLDQLVRYINVSLFVSTFHVSFGAGIPITEALYISAQTVSNHHSRRAGPGKPANSGGTKTGCVALTNRTNPGSGFIDALHGRRIGRFGDHARE